MRGCVTVKNTSHSEDEIRIAEVFHREVRMSVETDDEVTPVFTNESFIEMFEYR